jgi:Family of unknown function (DUF6491)
VKKAILATAVLVFLGGTAHAKNDSADYADSYDLERVGKFRIMNRLDGWRALDRNTLIVWSSPFRPYLVELTRDSHGLRHAFAIGITSTAGSVYERFDSVVVDGFRYPIEAIYELDAKTARQLKRA